MSHVNKESGSDMCCDPCSVFMTLSCVFMLFVRGKPTQWVSLSPQAQILSMTPTDWIWRASLWWSKYLFSREIQSHRNTARNKNTQNFSLLTKVNSTMKFGLVGRKEKKELKVFDQNLKCHQKQNICANYRSVLNSLVWIWLNKSQIKLPLFGRRTTMK